MYCVSVGEPRNKLTQIQSIFNKGVKAIQWGKDSLSTNDVITYWGRWK